MKKKKNTICSKSRKLIEEIVLHRNIEIANIDSYAIENLRYWRSRSYFGKFQRKGILGKTGLEGGEESRT